MNREQFERIANDEIDGIATPEDREALRRYLDGNPEAGESYRALQEMVGTLNQVGLESPPSDLKPNILRATTSRAEAPAPVTEGGFWRSLLAGVFHSVPWREAVPFAAGVGVGVLAIALVSGDLVGSSRDRLVSLRGTMMPRAAHRDAPGDAPAAEQNVIAVADARVTVTTWGSGSSLKLRIEVEPGATDEAVVEVTGPTFRVSELRIDPPGAGDATVGPTGIRIGQRAGNGVGAYVLQLRGEEAPVAPLEIVVRSGGQAARTAVKVGSSGSARYTQ
ncbi:MAG: hypothetical protein AAB011_13890 [Candidatus Eisenbacteria bacterium]